MDFAQYINTAHTIYTEASPLITTIKLTKGRIVGGLLYFPTGPAATLHVKVLRGGRQIVPATPGQNYRLDDAVVDLFVNLDLTEPPLSLDIHTWNDSTSNDHALTICFFLDPYLPPRGPMSWLKRIMGKPQEEAGA